MRVNGTGEAAEQLRELFRQAAEKSAKRQRQEDADFKKVRPRLQWLIENQYQVTPQYLAHDTRIPLKRIEAIEDRLGELAKKIIGEGSYCP